MAKKKSTSKKSTKKKTPARKKPAASQKRVAFTYEAPDAREVLVTGSFCGWDDGVPLERDGKGCWKATVSLPKGDHEYRFRVDGEWRNDPDCSDRVPNRFGSENCVVHV